MPTRKMSWRLHNPYSTISKLIARDGLNCCWCGIECNRNSHPNADDYPTIEHLIPKSKGGKITMENCKVACRKCNGLRGNPDFDGVFTPGTWEKKKRKRDYLLHAPTLGENFSFDELSRNLSGKKIKLGDCFTKVAKNPTI